MAGQPQPLSPYWKRLTGKAEEILLAKIERLERSVVDPACCLLPDDVRVMALRQIDLEGVRGILDAVRQGGLASRLWALDTVLGHSPCLVFGR